MVNENIIRFLIKKSEGELITLKTTSCILKNYSLRQVSELLNESEQQGYLIKDIDIDFWHVTMKGEILRNKILNKTYRVKTIKRVLNALKERIEEINSSDSHVYNVTSVKVDCLFPLRDRNGPINVYYTIKEKKLSREEHDRRSKALRINSNRRFNSIMDYYTYDYTIIGAILKSRSHILNIIRTYEDNFHEIDGEVFYIYSL